MKTGNEEERAKILVKLEKLLALQNSAEKLGNLEEAANAADKVKKLLLRYNLSLDDVGKQAQPVGITILSLVSFGYNPRESDWLFGLTTILGDYYMNKVFFIKNTDPPMAQFVGRETNVAACFSAIIQMSSAIRHFARRDYKDLGSKPGLKWGKFARSYYQGAIRGLNTILARKAKEAELAAQQRANEDFGESQVPMVILNQVEKQERGALDEFLKKQDWGIKSEKPKERAMDLAMVLGYERGLTLHPQQALEKGKKG